MCVGTEDSGHHPVCGYQVRVSLSSKSIPSPNYRDLFVLLEGGKKGWEDTVQIFS